MGTLKLTFKKMAKQKPLLLLVLEKSEAVGGDQMTILFLATTVIPELHNKGSVLLTIEGMTGLSAAMPITPQTREATEVTGTPGSRTIIYT